MSKYLFGRALTVGHQLSTAICTIYNFIVTQYSIRFIDVGFLRGDAVVQYIKAVAKVADLTRRRERQVSFDCRYSVSDIQASQKGSVQESIRWKDLRKKTSSLNPY